MKLVVLDPGLDSTAGHHYHLDLVLKEQAAAHGMDMVLCGFRGMDPAVEAEFDARLIFERHCYAHATGPHELTVVLNRTVNNHAFHRDLCASGLTFGPDDLIVMHTVLGNQMVGFYLWYRDLPEPRPRVCIILRFPPWFHLTREHHEVAVALDRHALALWTAFPPDRVMIAADNRGLADFYGKLMGLEIPDLPIPIRYPDPHAGASSPESARPGPPRFVYLGEAREEKGIHLVYEALRRRLPVLDGIHFTIQCGRPELLGGLLDEWRRELPEVDFIDRNLTEAEYLALLAGADAVVVPYQPDIYDVRTSHVFLEAVGAGKPVMITAGTWMDLELERLGHFGVKAAEFSPDGVSDGLAALASQWRVLAGHATGAAERCRAIHNPEEFFRRLLGLFNEPADESNTAYPYRIPTTNATA
jgi:glycosyltransferase involved in cell wall biosynthesis